VQLLAVVIFHGPMETLLKLIAGLLSSLQHASTENTLTGGSAVVENVILINGISL
jgi:hypothetical protein